MLGVAVPCVLTDAVEAERPHFLVQLLVVSDNHAAFAGRKVLRGVETEADRITSLTGFTAVLRLLADRNSRPRPHVQHPRSRKSLFHGQDRQMEFMSQGKTTEMDGNELPVFDPSTVPAIDAVIDVPVFTHVGQDRCRADLQNRVDSRAEGQRSRDDLVAGPDAQRRK